MQSSRRYRLRRHFQKWKKDAARADVVLVCTEGPRFETPAEIELFEHLDCDVAGVASLPEVVLSRELQMCHASICYVSNMVAGIQGRLTTSEVSKVSKQIIPKMKEVLIERLVCQ